MSTHPPARLDPWQMCDRRQVVSGRQALAAFPRLVPLLSSATGEAVYELAFSRDPEGRAVIDCRVDAELVLVCQRCLAEMTQPVRAHSRVAVVVGLDESADLPDDVEPLLAIDGVVAPLNLVEDELLLALPAVPRHAPGACHASDVSNPDMQQAENPFSILASLKTGKKDN